MWLPAAAYSLDRHGRQERAQNGVYRFRILEDARHIRIQLDGYGCSLRPSGKTVRLPFGVIETVLWLEPAGSILFWFSA